MSDEDKKKQDEPEEKTEEGMDPLADEVGDFVSKIQELDSDEHPDDEPVTVETVAVPKEKQKDDSAKSEKDTSSGKDNTEDAPPTMSLDEMGIGEDALPELDPETGNLVLDGQVIEEGVKVFIYNEIGQPVFGFMLEDGSVVVTAEEGASGVSVGVKPTKKSKKKKKKKKAKKKTTKTNTAATESSEKKVALKSTSERRARAKAKATGKRIAVEPTKKKASFMFTFFLMFSTLSCLGFIGWYSFLDGKTVVQQYLKPEDVKPVVPGGNEMLASFNPRAFGPSEMDVTGAVDAAQAQLTEAGWVIAAPSSDPKWALWSSGVIENGVANGKGTIQRRRKGDDDFHISFLAGFFKGPKDKPDKQGNMTILLNAPEARKKVFFGFGVQLNQLFIVPFHGSKKGEERRHPPKINLAYNTWYKVDAKADGRFVNFYFNGQKVDGVQMNASAIKDVALTNIKSRIFYRDFKMKEDGIAEVTTTVAPTATESDPQPEVEEESNSID